MNAFRHAISQQVSTSIGIFTNTGHLIMPKTYQEFFQIRTQKCFNFPHIEKFFNWNSQRESFRYFFTPQYVTFDVLTPPPDLVEIIEGIDLLQFGGQRHSGFGMVSLQDSLLIDIDNLLMPRNATHLTLIAPMAYILPWVEKFDCRWEPMTIWNHGRINQIEVVAPRQFFRIKSGIEISSLAMKGILRKVRSNKALFSQFGFGEFVLHDWSRRKSHNA